MAQDMQDAGNVSAELDAMVCDLIGAFLDDLAAGVKDEGLGRIARYAIGYTGCVEIDGGYHDALLVSFFETTLESGFSAYVLYEGVGAGDGFMWSDPEPAGEETPLI